MPFNCTNTASNITLNENRTYTMTNLNSSCAYNFFETNASIYIVVITESSNYVKNNNSLLTTFTPDRF